jgi:segregation and condensation protein B
LLFASAEPVPDKVIAERLPEGADVEGLLSELVSLYSNRGVNVIKAGKGWGFRTAVDLGPQLIVERVVNRKLSRAAVETLAIVAYHQPITRAEIEEIRSVGLSRGTMDILFENGWIRPRGRRRSPGKPVTWGTTESFLDQFAMESLDDLPGMDELKAAGLLDKRPAIQTLGTRAPAPSDPDLLEEAPEADDGSIEELDPDDGDQLASLDAE